MNYPSPDPSASLTPFQTYSVQIINASLDKVQWMMVLGFVFASLALVFLVIIAVSTAYRR